MIGIVFSRNRAMQLDATLRSFFRHCADPDEVHLFVLFQATDQRHVRQYHELAANFAHCVQFVPETKFRLDLLRLLMRGSDNGKVRRVECALLDVAPKVRPLRRLFSSTDRYSHVLFLVDDNIFTRRFSLAAARNALNIRSRALGFSLRLGLNITYSYMQDKEETLPAFEPVADDILLFDWTTSESSFGYPLEVSSSVYRLDQLFPLLVGTRFRKPNSLEDRMAQQAACFRAHLPRLLCFSQSVTFCNPINMVQTEWVNRVSDKPEYSSAALADLFDAGQRIIVEVYDGLVPGACHQEVKLEFASKE